MGDRRQVIGEKVGYVTLVSNIGDKYDRGRGSCDTRTYLGFLSSNASRLVPPIKGRSANERLWFRQTILTTELIAL